jgi:hypothetical protein
MRCVTVPKLLFLSCILFDDVKARSGCSPEAIVVRAEPLMCCRPIFFTWPDHIYCCKPPCCVHIVRHTCTVFGWSSHFNWIYTAPKRSYTFLHLYFPTVLVQSFMCILSHQLPAIFICYLQFPYVNATVQNFMPEKTDCVLTVSQYCKYDFWLGIPPRYVVFRILATVLVCSFLRVSFTHTLVRNLCFPRSMYFCLSRFPPHPINSFSLDFPRGIRLSILATVT